MRGSTETQQTRRDEGPLTGRGAQTKSALLSAARQVFERRGFADVRVKDIVKEAQVSHGTFYTYFDTKEAIFREVSLVVVNDMLESMTSPNTSANFHGRVHDAILRYVRAYRPNAKIIALMDQVSFSAPELRNLRLDVRRAFVERTERGIKRMQALGLADADLDVEYTAEALGAMIEYTCYMWFTLDHPFEEDRLIDALADVWEKALQPARSPD
ncbi:helix-turn-helix domain-containing protein [Rhodococcus ruber]|uniref:TetR/AcrR family transcriptional regulator n=1 Tax=Rhodococcus ruber TaxID=1830 RepID=UPI00315CFF9C